jgi:hypothetical protein
MWYSRSTLLCCLCALPLVGHSADTYQLSKTTLQCLYNQAESLLTEPGEPLLILLNQCNQTSTSLMSGEKTGLAPIEPAVDSKPTLKPEDVLVLTHMELQCFKQDFERYKQESTEPVTVIFRDTCPTQGSTP